MDKAMRILEAWLDGRRYGGMKAPPLYTVWELGNVLHDLARSGEAQTISGEVRDVLEKCGFDIAEDGIGWSIT